ncbi:MAG TPA: TOBE domain-containing protein, partial [Ilumatobacteraceae bacterium]|nr:TOBE domain-containing protein [Ilumatobacteraceae bacterium]
MPAEIVDRDGDDAVVQLDAGPRLRLPCNGAGVGDPATVMLRPERLHISVDDPGTVNSVHGVINNSIFQGSELRLIIHLENRT